MSPTSLTWIWFTGAVADFPKDDDVLFPILKRILKGSAALNIKDNH